MTVPPRHSQITCVTYFLTAMKKKQQQQKTLINNTNKYTGSTDFPQNTEQLLSKNFVYKNMYLK